MRCSSLTLTTPYFSFSQSHTTLGGLMLPLIDELGAGLSRRFRTAVAPLQPLAWEDDDDDDDEDFVDDDEDVDVGDEDDDDFFDDDDEDLDEEDDTEE